MSANFTLAAANPAVTTAPENIVYTGLPAGNTIDLTIGNNSGFDLTIGGSSAGEYLVLQISGNILDDAAAAQLGVASPWQTAGYTAPAQSGGFYSFNLQPPAGGIDLPDGGIIQVQMLALQPAAKGTAQIIVDYLIDTSGDALQAAATLIALAPPDPDLPVLVGPDAALRFSFLVNNNDESTPILVSAAPVTSQNGEENTLQMIFNFQAQAAGDTNGAWLLDSWDAANPPQLCFFFPYFCPENTDPSAIDLTDVLRSGSTYNALTSAWNILASLDPSDPQIQNNGNWQIALDNSAPLPVWQAVPTAANTHVFTASGGPGPLLNLFWSHIYSGLPIDPDNPETMLYVQWMNFPGFSDGIQVFPLLKAYPKPAIEPVINNFTGELVQDVDGVHVSLNWSTGNAASCMLSGETGLLSPNTDTTPYTRKISIGHPLPGSFTLVAVAADGTQSAPWTLRTQWRVNTALSPPSRNNSIQIAISCDGATLFLLQTDVTSGTNSTISFVDPGTLQDVSAPYTSEFLNFISMQADPVQPGRAYLVSYYPNFSLCAYDMSAGQIQQSAPVSAPTNLIQMGITSDGSTAAIAANGIGTTPLLYLFETAGLDNRSGSPVTLLLSPVSTFTIGPQSGRYYIDYVMQLNVLDATSFDCIGNYTLPGLFTQMVFTPDEQSVFLIGPETLARYETAGMTQQQSVATGLLGQPGGLSGAPVFPSLLTPDGQLLLIAGTDNATGNPSIQVFDSNTLALLDDSAWNGQTDNVASLQISPDGTRVFVLTAGGDLYALDPMLI